MPMMMQQYSQPASHYEYSTVAHTNSSNSEKLKQQVFRSMDELEGWCTKEKASILIDLILKYKPKKIVEIGVFGGKSLIPMAYALKELGRGKIHGIDPWDANASVEGMDGVNRDWWGKLDHGKILRNLEEKIVKFNLQNQIQLIKTTSEAASPIYDIEMLHIDGNHSDEKSFLDLKWVQWVKKHGIIIFDDLHAFGTDRAVNWLNTHCTKIAEYKGDSNWGIWIKN